MDVSLVSALLITSDLYGIALLYFHLIRRRRSSTLFPYTTLFRSVVDADPATAAGDPAPAAWATLDANGLLVADRKSTRLNSSHVRISYAVFCLKKKDKLADLASVWPVMIHPSRMCPYSS